MSRDRCAGGGIRTLIEIFTFNRVLIPRNSEKLLIVLMFGGSMIMKISFYLDTQAHKVEEIVYLFRL